MRSEVGGLSSDGCFLLPLPGLAAVAGGPDFRRRRGHGAVLWIREFHTEHVASQRRTGKRGQNPRPAITAIAGME